MFISSSHDLQETPLNTNQNIVVNVVVIVIVVVVVVVVVVIVVINCRRCRRWRVGGLEGWSRE